MLRRPRQHGTGRSTGQKNWTTLNQDSDNQQAKRRPTTRDTNQSNQSAADDGGGPAVSKAARDDREGFCWRAFAEKVAPGGGVPPGKSASLRCFDSCAAAESNFGSGALLKNTSFFFRGRDESARGFRWGGFLYRIPVMGILQKA